MSNFEKDLRDLTDDELYSGINNLNPNYMSLYSDELTRRSTDKWSQKIVDLTILIFFVGLFQLLVALGAISASWREWLFLTIFILYAFYYIARRLKKSPKPR
jgi:hypothetical protein